MNTKDWDKIMSDIYIYEYTFHVNEEQLRNYRVSKFKGTYIVHRKNGKAEKVII